EQQAEAEAVIRELEVAKLWADPIVTEVLPLDRFYPAEAYHRDYYRRNPDQGYCRVVIAPKVAKVRKHYFEKLRK
ncbi:MAG: peptide-methionine (S)-S-oxide reductase, partial [Gemmatimonadetes bacterium]|nr:peptide-methionine (S)-S-oxide reductase [Gemmatimonadota bacterium]